MKDDIQIKSVFQNLFFRKKFILIFTLFFLILGLVVSYIQKDKYTAQSTFYPHYEKNENNNLRNLAGLAGISLSTNSFSEVPSSLYPNLINSTPFKNSILNESITFNDQEMIYKNYILLNHLNKVPDDDLQIKEKLFEFKEVINLTNDEYLLHNYLNSLISINVNSIDGYIDLKVTDTDPYIAASIAKKAEQILQSSVINYKLGNINSVFEFTSKQLNEIKEKFYSFQDSLANFKDSNRNIKSDLFNNKLERIQSEYNLYKSIYNELALSKEKVAIDVQKRTPIFTIINPVTLPKEKSSPNRKLIIIIFVFIGLTLSIFISMIEKKLLEIYNEIFN